MQLTGAPQSLRMRGACHRAGEGGGTARVGHPPPQLLLEWGLCEAGAGELARALDTLEEGARLPDPHPPPPEALAAVAARAREAGLAAEVEGGLARATGQRSSSSSSSTAGAALRHCQAAVEVGRCCQPSSLTHPLQWACPLAHRRMAVTRAS